eukprot:jgi/Botrbrau1/15686/Bobra.4_1s0064.1
MPPGNGKKAWWEAWLELSAFSFAAPDLEGRFQRYVTKSFNICTLLIAAHIFTGWAFFVHKLFTVSGEMRALLHPSWPEGLLHPLLALLVLGLMFGAPAVYQKHQRLIHALVKVALISTFRSTRGLLLWMKDVEAKEGPRSWISLVQLFFVENFFLSMVWFGVLAFPSGQVADLVLITVMLMLDMRHNRDFCASLRPGKELASTTPQLHGVTRRAIVWVRNVGGPSLGAHASSPAITCPMALGFWQLVGWLLACVAVCAGDVMRRRAFLRTHEARVQLGRAWEVEALFWPFGSAGLIYQKASLALVFLILGVSLLWSSVIDFI